MAKKTANFRLDQDSIDALKLLAEKHSRSQANMLEVLIKQAAKKEGIIK
jgi:hypothetical protein